MELPSNFRTGLPRAPKDLRKMTLADPGLPLQFNLGEPLMLGDSKDLAHKGRQIGGCFLHTMHKNTFRC